MIGSGGREHALAWKAKASPLVSEVFVAPGNAGTGREDGVVNVSLSADDREGLLCFAKQNHIDLTIVGPEGPLVAGLSDDFNQAGLTCFGPSAQAARLEGSKSFAKEFMARHGIPTAKHQSFSDTAQAIAYLDRCEFPLVIKADGLAAGKGVIIASDYHHARETILDMLAENKFGDAGSRVVIEEFLRGEEASFICIVGGSEVLPMATSQDHKAAYDGDRGPNTGGMGAYSPSPLIDEKVFNRVLGRIIYPTVNGLIDEGMPYTGFLYAGLMIDENGSPHVIEFNCRFGDPEAQPVLTRLKTDLVAHCMAALHGVLGHEQAQWDTRPCLGVVMAAEGYPGRYEKGDIIHGLEQNSPEGVNVFHAGTADVNGKIVTNGGRVLCVTGLAETVKEAQQHVYRRVNAIHWPGAWCRNDIGHRAIARENRSRETDQGKQARENEIVKGQR